jgi:hypothetical protein
MVDDDLNPRAFAVQHTIVLSIKPDDVMTKAIGVDQIFLYKSQAVCSLSAGPVKC